MAIDYHIRCKTHGDQVVNRSHTEMWMADDGFRYLPCDCGEPGRIVVHPVRTEGIIAGEFNEQLGVEFSSNADKRRWLAANPTTREMGSDSKEYRVHRERWRDQYSDQKSGKVKKKKPAHNGRIKSVTPVTL